MKFTARVEQVLHSGIHRIAIDRRDAELVFNALPLPTYVEIEVDDSGQATLYRYRDDGAFCGDTWHESLQDAKDQAAYEYGISELAWQITP